MGRFRRGEAGVVVFLEPMESAVLSQLMGEMLDVIGQAPEPAPGEQWAHDLGLDAVGQPPEGAPGAGTPTDPITARLFPDAYRDDDEAAADFRRFTGEDLRAGKSENAQRLIRTLAADGGPITLDDDDCSAWLGALNDARLVLGTSLDVTDDIEFERAVLEADEPRTQQLFAYDWLGQLMAALLDALMVD